MLKLVAVLLVLAASVNATYLESSLSTYEPGYQLITSFCFAPTYIADAMLDYMIMYPASYQVQKLFLIPEEQWRNGLNSCDELSNILSSEHIIELQPGEMNSGCQSVYVNYREHYNCTNSIRMSSESPRRWYIAIARCGVSNNWMGVLIVTHYKLHLTNGDSEDNANGCYVDMIAASASTNALWTPVAVLTAAALFKLLL